MVHQRIRVLGHGGPRADQLGARHVDRLAPRCGCGDRRVFPPIEGLRHRGCRVAAPGRRYRICRGAIEVNRTRVRGILRERGNRDQQRGGDSQDREANAHGASAWKAAIWGMLPIDYSAWADARRHPLSQNASNSHCACVWMMPIHRRLAGLIGLLWCVAQPLAAQDCSPSGSELNVAASRAAAAFLGGNTADAANRWDRSAWWASANTALPAPADLATFYEPPKIDRRACATGAVVGGLAGAAVFAAFWVVASDNGSRFFDGWKSTAAVVGLAGFGALFGCALTV